jgi:hypothetical protein
MISTASNQDFETSPSRSKQSVTTLPNHQRISGIVIESINPQRALYEIIYRPHEAGDELDVSVAMMAMIFCRNGFRDAPLGSRVIANQVTKVRESLDSLPGEALQPRDLKMRTRLFWILGLSGTVAEGMEERTWYVREYVTLFESTGGVEWDDAKAILQSILWHPELDEPGWRLWREARAGSL